MFLPVAFDEPRLLHVGRDCSVGAWRNALVVVFRSVVPAAALEVVLQSARGLFERHAQGIGVLGVAPADHSLGEDDKAKCEDVLFDAFGSRLLCVASVVEGGSYLAGCKRDVMSALSSVARQPCPARVFGTVDEAVSWQAPLLGTATCEPMMLAPFRRAVEAVRRNLQAA